MSSRIEVEAKYFIKENKEFLKLIESNNFEKCNKIYEEDIYFTDIDSNYIKNRTCLRIRKNDKNLMELTFKGKSIVNKETYIKKENNISVNEKDIDELIGILNDLGYYIYVVVKKDRITYTKKQNNLDYNIMIDNIPNVGNFVEFEILCEDETKSIDILKEELNNFVNKFNKTTNMEIAKLPYRDFVALEYNKKIQNNNNKKNLLLDFDGTLVNSEKEFFKAFRDTILEKYNYEITYKEYKENELDQNSNLIKMLKEKYIINPEIKEQEIMDNVYLKYDNYFDNVLEDKDTILNIELLKKLKNKGYDICIISTSKKKYINKLIEKFNLKDLFEYIISREDVKEQKPSKEAYEKVLNELKIDTKTCLAVEDSNRGVKAAIDAEIDVVKVNGFSMIKEEHSEKIFNMNNFAELALILLNH